MDRRGLFSGLRIVSLCTLLSRVLGLVRDNLMARLFGSGALMDAFSVAFRIPNLARAMFGEGALTTAFLPAAVKELDSGGKTGAWRLATAVFAVLSIVLTGVVLVAELLLAIAWHYCRHLPEHALLIGLTATMLPYLILICLAAQAGALQQALGRFAWPALVPVILNLVWLASMLLVIPQFAEDVTRIYAVGITVVVAGALQLLAPMVALRREGFVLAGDWRAALPQVRQVARAVIPVVIGLSITQINTLSDSLIAWGFSPPASGTTTMPLPGNPEYPLETGTASALYYGQRLYQFPLGVFGVALGTVMFPLLARHAGRGQFEELRQDLRLGLTLVLAIGLPASVGLVLLASPITSLIFQYGAFDAQAAARTSAIIAAYGSGVWAYCGISIVHRAYYALGDRLTPLRIGIFVVLLNLLLNLILIWHFGGTAIALATSLTAMVQLGLGLRLLESRTGSLQWKIVARSSLRIVVATSVMAIAILATRAWLESLIAGDDFLSRGARAAGPICTGLAVYLLSARLLNIAELRMIFSRGEPPPATEPVSSPED